MEGKRSARRSLGHVKRISSAIKISEESPTQVIEKQVREKPKTAHPKNRQKSIQFRNASTNI